MNLLYDLARHESFVTQWLEHPTGVWKIIGSTSFGDLDFSLSHTGDMLNASFSNLFLLFFLCCSCGFFL